MSISRRQFILGTAAGLILPSYYDKVFSYFENNGEPLLEIPKTSDIELIAADWGYDGGFPLLWYGPEPEPPEMTVREFADRYFGCLDRYFEGDCQEGMDPDEVMDPDIMLGTWECHDGPEGRASRLLEGIDLGPELSGEDSVGEIRFIPGDRPFWWAQAADEVSLSLLQKRLNDLGTGIHIK